MLCGKLLGCRTFGEVSNWKVVCMRGLGGSVVWLVVLVCAGCEARRGGAPAAVDAQWVRTELFFGLTKPDGGMVTDAEWKRFLDESVTPRFPDGLTAMRATGWYRGSNDGKLHEEPSGVLIILRPAGAVAGTEDRVREMTAEYIRKFDQESVLRSDSAVSASFITVETGRAVEKALDGAGKRSQ
jgi:hypothetical protein